MLHSEHDNLIVLKAKAILLKYFEAFEIHRLNESLEIL